MGDEQEKLLDEALGIVKVICSFLLKEKILMIFTHRCKLSK